MNKLYLLVGAALIILATLVGVVLALWNHPLTAPRTSQVSTTPVLVGCLPRPTLTPFPTRTPFTLTPAPPTPAPSPTQGPPAPTSTFVAPTLVHPLTEEEVLKRALDIDTNTTDWDDPWCIETLHLQPGRITFAWHRNEYDYPGGESIAAYLGIDPSKTNPIWAVTITGNVRVEMICGLCQRPIKAGGVEYRIDQKTGWLLGMGTLMSEEQAITNAVSYASISRPEVSAVQIPPPNLHAEQFTLAAAERLLTGTDNVPTGYDPNIIVWLVEMEGIWIDEAPRPTGSPTPEPYRHFSVIIDAKTGKVIQSSARP